MDREYINKNTIALMLAGSHAYGTNVEDSDVDLRGVAIIPERTEYMGFLDTFQQYSESEPKDLTIYGIRKAFALMAKCNPNMLELLFTRDQDHQIRTKYWDEVRLHRDLFLSTRAKHSYTGYAYSQLGRIQVARNWLLNPPKEKPERADFGLPNKNLISKDDLGAYQWILVNLLRESIDYLDFSEVTKEELLSSNLIGLVQKNGIPDNALDAVQKMTGASDEWMTIMQQEQAYANAKRNWDSYRKWKAGRNKKRAALEEKFGYDCKHAMHLVRLMRMGKEILETGRVQVFRPDADELLAIRNGAWSYEQVKEYAETMQNIIRESAKNTKLPAKADTESLNKLCTRVIEMYLTDQGK